MTRSPLMLRFEEEQEVVLRGVAEERAAIQREMRAIADAGSSGGWATWFARRRATLGPLTNCSSGTGLARMMPFRIAIRTSTRIAWSRRRARSRRCLWVLRAWVRRGGLSLSPRTGTRIRTRTPGRPFTSKNALPLPGLGRPGSGGSSAHLDSLRRTPGGRRLMSWEG